MKILITGSQGVGKSSIIKCININIEKITSISSRAAREGISINERGTLDSQKEIFNMFIDAIKDKDDYITDRCLIDVAAYTYAVYNRTHDFDVLLAAQKQETIAVDYIRNNPDIKIFYIPIEFDITNSQYRSTDKQFQKEIDSIIKDILDKNNLDYITLTGSISERAQQINSNISL